MTFPVSYIVGLELTPGSFTDISNDVRRIAYSRRVGSVFAGLGAGTVQVVLANTNKDYSSDVTTGINAGKLALNIGLKIQAVHSGTTYNLFKGFVDEYSSDPSLSNERRLTIIARDEVKFLSDRIITSSLLIDNTFSAAMTEIFNVSNISSFTIDTLIDKPSFVWFDKIQTTQAIKQVMDAGFFSTYVDGAGIFNFKDRLFGIDDPNSSSITRSNEFFGINWSLDDLDVINKVTVSGTPRKLLAVVGTIAVLSEVIEVAASSTIGFELGFIDPFNNEPAPAASLFAVGSGDFTTNTASDGTGSNQNSAVSVTAAFFGASAVATLTNNAGFTIFLTGFNVRGSVVQRQPEVSFEFIDSPSQSTYGLRGFTLDSPFIDTQAYAEAYAKFIIDRNKNPVAKVVASLKNDFPNILARELGDAITLVEDHVGINSVFSIIGMNHNIQTEGGGWQHTANYEMEAITAPFSGSISKGRFGLTAADTINSSLGQTMLATITF